MRVRRWASVAVWLWLRWVASRVSASPTSPGVRPRAPASPRPIRSVTFLFVQNAAAGRLDPVAHERGVFTLTLQRVDPHVLFFTDRPVHESGVIPTADMIQGLFAHGIAAPNASVAT